MAIRLLGLDPGLRATGWGVIDVEGNYLSAVANGTVCAPDKDDLATRLQYIFSHLTDIIALHRPNECAIEETFVNKNPASTLKLGHARAAAMLAASNAGLGVSEYTPNAVKKAVVGAGHADKHQVETMVAMLLPGHKAASSDAADALAVAICHAHHRVSNQRLQRAMAAGAAR